MSHPGRGRRGTIAVAALLSAGWLAAAAVALWLLGPARAMWLAVAVAVALPLAGIWFAALVAREFARQAALLAEQVRRAAAADPPPTGLHRSAATGASHAPAAQTPLRLRHAAAEPSANARKVEGARPRPVDESAPRQGSLPLAIEAQSVALPVADLARALDFPDSESDQEGFRALRLALRDPRARRLVQASQDVITILADEGIYMDDLTPDRAPPELWRRFAAGERGTSMAAIGGIRDRSSLALTGARMRSDPVFRDAAHHFLRLFDSTLAQVAPEATDADLTWLADSRTARAFMLIGRAAGIFG